MNSDRAIMVNTAHNGRFNLTQHELTRQWGDGPIDPPAWFKAWSCALVIAHHTHCTESPAARAECRASFRL